MHACLNFILCKLSFCIGVSLKSNDNTKCSGTDKRTHPYAQGGNPLAASVLFLEEDRNKNKGCITII